MTLIKSEGRDVDTIITRTTVSSQYVSNILGILYFRSDQETGRFHIHVCLGLEKTKN